jgi:flavin reductase (DIM6/NTAB) family NADH-FMN oxidoreductase RutF
MKEKTAFSPDKRSWSPSPLAGQIVLVTTLNEDGQSNIAPKSWISMMAFDPPLLVLGCNLEHWTAKNILREREFVVNIPGEELAALVWRASEIPHPRTVEIAGLTPRAARKVKPPLVEECRAHLECIYRQHLVFGSEVMLVAEIVAGSIDKEVLDSPDPYHLFKMIFFLENGQYGIIESSSISPGNRTQPGYKTEGC